jgi:hypothetical protein
MRCRPAGTGARQCPLGRAGTGAGANYIRGKHMDLQVPIVVVDELTESVVRSNAVLDLASGEIRNLEYEDYDAALNGLPAEDPSYEFTSGTLSNMGREVEFRVEVDVLSGKYSVTASELLELKGRAAKLFTRPPGRG